MSDEHRPIRVTLVNDYEIIVHGLARMLDPFHDRIEIVELEAGGLPEQPTDIALFDTFAGRRQSLRRVNDLADDLDVGKVVLYTWDLPDAFHEEVDASSVDAVVFKSATGEQLVESLERVHRGDRIDADRLVVGASSSPLTEREREVLALIALGRTNREIADELYLSFDTVKTHVRKLFAKLGVSNRTQAALLARDHGVAPPVSSWDD